MAPVLRNLEDILLIVNLECDQLNTILFRFPSVSYSNFFSTLETDGCGHCIKGQYW